MLATAKITESIRNFDVILASKSPRRREILSQLGLDFRIVPSKFEENFDKSTFPNPTAYVQETALQKALEVQQRLENSDKPELIISADTIVVLDGTILEKPNDEAHAFEMLSSLSGKSHEVITSVTLLTRQNSCSFSEQTQVKFMEMSSEMIQSYIDSKEPMDKAGGYGIQGIGGSFIEKISGCYFNVVGFPQHRFCCNLIKLLEQEESNARETPQKNEEANGTSNKRQKTLQDESKQNV
mmetsp:Transcript_37597/g.49547  ORF Transcript_37597/g.49547 Transcript_37597/m.49547 type:complete len:240 (+) Transcript_37597:86-805(+)|eukprot:CAMPEP_0117750830 /NCGR_PEP_ID=MMETSP0947-20121206/10612_1 /TAXON_ID=44440 /ORGANISM="Chattonella subsalsa, Strain CCMP2191" /LENGTH=239 /DNA_ID=CAMNT_0005569093 /DNA_START=208 /DNA_END=927 /DNA_ORIENTATION=-